MTKLFAIEYERQESYWYVARAPEAYECTDRQLRDQVVLPRGVRRVWLVAHDRPGTNRFKAAVWGSREYFLTIAEVRGCNGDATSYLVTHLATDDLLRPFAGRTVYVEIQYEEP